MIGDIIMKKFLTLTLTALLLAVVMSLSLFAFNATATENKEITYSENESKNVIFISDNYDTGDGSGRNAANPFRPDPNAFFILEKKNEYNYYGRYYLRTALYQAADKLSSTGGTIVICGPVNIDRTNTFGSSWTAKDFYMPESEHKLTITSVYGGVDYRSTNGAFLHIAAPAHLTLGSPVTMEYLDIKTTTDFNPAWEYTLDDDGEKVYTHDEDGFRIRAKDANGDPAFELNASGEKVESGDYRTISANGYKLVMGKGINCYHTEGSASESKYGGRFPTIVGGLRHGNLNRNVDVTIESGRYGGVCGSIFGAWTEAKNEDGSNKVDQYGKKFYNHYTLKGDVNITILGGVFRTPVSAGSTKNHNSVIDGDVNIYIGPTVNAQPQFGSHIYAVGTNQFASEDCKIYLKIMGGRYYVSGTAEKPGGAMVFEKNTGTDVANIDCVTYPASESILDLSEASNLAFWKDSKNTNTYTEDFPLHAWIKTSGFENIIYPSSWLTEVKCSGGEAGTVVPPTQIDTYINGISKPTEAVVKATYTNLVTNETGIVKYVEYDERNGSFKETYNSDTKKISYTYGGKEYHSADVTNYVEAPTVELLGVRLKTADTADQAMRFVAKYNGTANVVDQGVIVVKSHAVTDPDNITLENTFGQIECKKGEVYTKADGSYFEYDYKYPIKLGEYNTNYTARAYVKYKIDEKTYTSYSNAIERNPYEVARAAVNGDKETDGSNGTVDTKGNLTKNILMKINVFDDTALRVDEENKGELTAIRKKVTDYMYLQANIPWTPSETFFMYNNLSDKGIAPYRYQYESGSIVEGVTTGGTLFEAGTTYYGMPYISSSDPDMENANYESFTSYINKGVFDIDQIVRYEEDGETIKLVGDANRNEVYSNFTQLAKVIHPLDNKYEYTSGTVESFANKLDYIDRAKAYINYTIFPGSHCTQAVFSAWNQIINNRKAASDVDATYAMVPGRGNAIIPVGDYEYVYRDYSAYNGGYTGKDNSSTVSDITYYGRYVTNEDGTQQPIRESDSLYIAKYLNDKDTMYAAYSALQPGDGMIHYVYSYNVVSEKWTGSGHARLVLEVTEKEYKGEMVPVVKTLECANYTVPYEVFGDAGFGKEPDSDNKSCWRVREYSFDNLIDSGYLPVTLPELRTGIQEQNYVVLTDAKFAAGTLEGTITSSKQIVSIDVTINGEKYDTKYVVDDARHLRTYDISKLGLGEEFVAGNSYTVTITVGTPGTVNYDNDGNPTGYTPTQETIVNYTFTA